MTVNEAKRLTKSSCVSQHDLVHITIAHQTSFTLYPQPPISARYPTIPRSSQKTPPKPNPTHNINHIPILRPKESPISITHPTNPKQSQTPKIPFTKTSSHPSQWPHPHVSDKRKSPAHSTPPYAASPNSTNPSAKRNASSHHSSPHQCATYRANSHDLRTQFGFDRCQSGVSFEPRVVPYWSL